jgi:hypothetical protein
MTDDATFGKVSPSEKQLYGPRKLLLCGFSDQVQPNFVKLLELIELSDIPKVWVSDDQAGTIVGELIALADGSGFGQPSNLPRAIIMAGITQNEMHQLMSGCRQAEMKPPLWATLPPTSETWVLEALLKELAAERAAIQKKSDH